MPDVDTPTAETLLLRQITGFGPPAGGGPLTEEQLTREAGLLAGLAADQLVAGVARLLSSILDHINAVEMGPDGRRFVDSCERARRRLVAALPAGSLATGLVSFACLNAELLRRRFEPPDRLEQERSDAYCRSLFEEGAIRAALFALYAPDGPAATAPAHQAAQREWRRLDPESFRYFRAGTTSVILLAREAEADASGHREERVVKCVLFPWSKIPAVANATDGYTRTYGAGRAPDVVVRPRASTDRWVVMPLQPGLTLHDYLLGLAAEPSWALPATRIRVARRIAQALVAALGRLAGPATESGEADQYPAIQHLDLSPNNVMVAPDGDVHFIDLGVNHLYTRQIGISDHDDSVYVAPEVKNRGQSPTADVYSLGVILIGILAGQVARDGRVPDLVYEISPALGRVIEDLIDEDPHRRLLLLPAGRPFRYPALHTMLDNAFAAAESEPIASESTFARSYARFAPASRELWTQFRRWRARRQAGDDTSSYLLFFSVLATAVWGFVVARTGGPLLAELGSLGQPLPATAIAAVVALGQGLVMAKFYQTVLARLTTRHVPGLLARSTELVMRTMPFVALPTVLLAVGWKPWLWTWVCAAGATAVAASNLLTLVTARKLFAAGRANQLSTVPPAGSELPRGYEQWWWTMLLYAVIIGIIAWGLQTGWVTDEHAYVWGLLLVNVGIHYISKIAIAGPAIRGGLARAFVVGERLALFERRSEVALADWPPRLRRPAWWAPRRLAAELATAARADVP